MYSRFTRRFTTWLMAFPILGAVFSIPALAKEDGRKLKNRVEPIHSQAARDLDIAGHVQLLVAIAPDGRVKDVKPLGGHPALVSCAVDAVREWQYEMAPHESLTTVELSFPR